MVYHENFVAVVTCNGDICRELANNTVLLPLGAEYGLRFKNKEARKALISVNIDGVDVLSDQGIIVPPDGTVDLEGFLDDAGKVTHKFKFIKKTEQISKHRGDRIDDGIVTVQYRFEQRPPIVQTHIHHDYIAPPIYPHIPYPWKHPGPIWRGGPHAQSNYEISANASPLRGMNMTGSAETYDSMPISSMGDDGITVKGSSSDQQFGSGHIGTLEANTHTICIHLRGGTVARTVTKPLTVRTKLICETCGTKNKSSAAFCSECGTALR